VFLPLSPSYRAKEIDHFSLAQEKKQSIRRNKERQDDEITPCMYYTRTFIFAKKKIER